MRSLPVVLGVDWIETVALCVAWRFWWLSCGPQRVRVPSAFLFLPVALARLPGHSTFLSCSALIHRGASSTEEPESPDDSDEFENPMTKDDDDDEDTPKEDAGAEEEAVTEQRAS